MDKTYTYHRIRRYLLFKKMQIKGEDNIISLARNRDSIQS